MAYENLSGIFDKKVDGNLGQFPLNTNPVVLIIGTADKGDAEVLSVVNRVSTSAKAYGSQGTLTRGLYEAAAAGALNIRLFRVGATSAILASIGTGVTVETARKDDSAGIDYKLYFDDTTDRLVVKRVSDNEVVYDNSSTYPIDNGEVFVTGTFSGSAGNIGTSSALLTLAAASGVSGASYTAGTDGVTLSKARLWEELYKTYLLLEDADLDVVVPMNVHLDEINTEEMTTAEVTTFNTSAPWASSSVYATAGTTFDGLGKVYVQEYNGKHYFWWDMDRDNVAELFPSVGSSSALLNASGTAITGADYNEVNFAYDLAQFCFTKSENNDEIIGVIGVKPPLSFGLADVSTWVGTAPVTTLDSDGVTTVITTNGTGLLGNKFMVGRLGSVATGLVGHPIGGVDGRYGGGFIANDGGFVNGGTELEDDNGKLVDLGKYISVVGAWATLANSSLDVSYQTTGAATYAGFFSALPPNSAPTNKVLSGVRLPFRLSHSKLDALAGAKYVMFQTKPKGIVVSDAPTAARAESDYTRLSTVRIVKAVLDAIRQVADPFLGEAITGARLAALETAIEQVLAKLTKAQFLQRYQHQLTSTPADQVLGKARVDLILVPAFELRQLTVSVSLAAS